MYLKSRTGPLRDQQGPPRVAGRLSLSRLPMGTTIERKWHIPERQGHIMASAFRKKSLNHFKLSPLRMAADREPLRIKCGPTSGPEGSASGRRASFSLACPWAPLSSENGTYQTDKARSWPRLSGKKHQPVWLFPFRLVAVVGGTLPYLRICRTILLNEFRV